MEKQKDMSGMLEMLPQGAFFVSDNTVCLVNQAARQLLIEPGTPIADLLDSTMEEYADFESGCLCSNDISFKALIAESCCLTYKLKKESS